MTRSVLVQVCGTAKEEPGSGRPRVQASSRVILQRWNIEGVTSSFSPHACPHDLANGVGM